MCTNELVLRRIHEDASALQELATECRMPFIAYLLGMILNETKRIMEPDRSHLAKR